MHMNKILKTTIYLILLSLTSQVSAQEKMFFIDRNKIMDSLKKANQVQVQLEHYEHELIDSILDIQYRLMLSLKQVNSGSCDYTVGAQMYLEDTLQKMENRIKFLSMQFDSLLDKKENELLDTIKITFDKQLHQYVLGKGCILDQSYLAYSKKIDIRINSENLFLDSIDFSQHPKIAVINQHQILEKLIVQSKARENLAAYYDQLDAEINRKRYRLKKYCEKHACRNCCGLDIYESNLNPPALQDYKNAYKEKDQRQVKKREQLEKMLWDKLDKMVTYLAQERNYTHVLDKSCLFYFDEIRTEDITDKVTEMLGLRE